MREIPYPKGLNLKKLKTAQKYLSIAEAIDCKLLHCFYSFLALSKF